MTPFIPLTHSINAFVAVSYWVNVARVLCIVNTPIKIDLGGSRNMGFARRIILGTAISALAVSMGIGTPASAATDKIVVIQEAPVIQQNEKVVEIGQTGSTLYFEGLLRSTTNKRIGLLTGQTTVINLFPESGEATVRYRELVFVLPRGQIVALGTSIYAAKGTTNFNNDNAPVRIAVVGGTGKYRSAQGEVITTKRADGSYRHVIVLDN